MMRWVVGQSLRFRRLVLAVALGAIVFGVLQASKMQTDTLPEFNPPMVEVQTEALGLSAAEVEQLITVPLEQDLLVGVAFLDEIESVSLPGLSSVVMTFEPGTDLLDARQVVQERLTQAVGIAGLPAVAKTPQMIQPLSSNSRVAMIEMSSSELTPTEMSVLARWVVGPRLTGVDGVANVAIWGNREHQLQVLVDPEQLREEKATLEQVIATAGNSLEVSPLSFLEASKPGTGGFIDTVNQRLNIFHEQAISSAKELAAVPLEVGDGGTATSPVTLGDVTKVVENHQPLIGDAICTGGDQCLLLVVEKFPGANTGAVTEEVETAIDAMLPGLPGIEMNTGIYRPATFVESSFERLGWMLAIGGALVLLVIGLFFWDWRRAVIAGSSILASLATAVLVLDARDTTINFMVAAGLILGLTAVIDDAINDTDKLARRIREGRELRPDRSIWQTISDAVTESRTGIVYATLIAAVATLPLFALENEGGAFLPPIALAYLLAIVISALVALILTPVLALLLLPKASSKRRESPVVGSLGRSHDKLFTRLLPRAGIALGVFAALAAIGLATLPFLDTELRPALKERDVIVQIQAAPGTSLPKMTGITQEIVDGLADLPEVSSVGGQIGRAIQSDQAVDVSSGEVWVTLDSEADYDDTLAAITGLASGFTDVTSEVKTYSEERVSDMLQDSTQDITVRLYGENADVLASKAAEAEELVGGLDGISGVNIDETPQETVVEVEVDIDAAREFGIKPGDVRRSASSLIGGITVGHLFQEQKVFDVVVWGAPAIRQGTADLERMLIDTPRGDTVRLGDVANVTPVESPAVIKHESVSRYVEMTADVSGRDVDDVATEVDDLVKQMEFPLEHHAEVLGDYEDKQAERTSLIALILAAALAVFLLLQAAFRSWRLAILAFVSLPLAAVGGLVAVLLTGGTIGLGAVVGLIAVLGIAARSIVLQVRHFQHLQYEEGAAFGPGLVLRGTRDRLAPIVMSTLAIALLLVPVVVTGAGSGLEIVHPMATVVLGGLVTTLVVALFVIPAIYLRYGSASDVDTSDDLFTDVPAPRSIQG